MVFSARDLNNFHPKCSSLFEAFKSLRIRYDAFTFIAKSAVEAETPTVDMATRVRSPSERVIRSTRNALDLLAFQRFQKRWLLNDLDRARLMNFVRGCLKIGMP